MDGSAGAVTASIGHGVKEIIEAMNKQAHKVSFVYRSQFTTHPAEQLAKKMSDISPGDLNWSFFVNSGSEATETAIDRKSTRLNSSHVAISYAVFCLKKKKKTKY